jgi:hypothetical protein
MAPTEERFFGANASAVEYDPLVRVVFIIKVTIWLS